MSRAVLLLVVLLGCEPNVAPLPVVRPATQVLIVFSATWCPPCQRAKPLVDQIERSGIKVIRYDIDTDTEEAAKYQIRSVPTFILVRRSVVLRTSDIGEVLKVLHAPKKPSLSQLPAAAATRSD